MACRNTQATASPRIYGNAIRNAAFAPQVATVRLPSGASASPTGLASPSATTVRRPSLSIRLTVVPP